MTLTMNDATRAQVEAARPDFSTWLAANAGSGKTRVLTDRVARLLLRGVDPQRILCLTYTKAAASEMQNRLFKRLGGWAMLDDTPLRAALRELGIEEELTPERLKSARTLFALAIETPGGLKIQTIHSFCAALLRRFPLESGVSPNFTEIEDRAADLLRAEIVDEMAQGPDAALVEGLAAFYTGEDFSSLTRTIVGMRDRFAEPLDLARALALFDQPTDLCAEMIERETFLGEEPALFRTLVSQLRNGTKTDQKAAEALSLIEKFTLRSLPALENLLLFGASAKAPFGAKVGSFPTKGVREALGNSLAPLEDLMQRVETARPRRLCLAAAEKTAALHAFAARFLARYAEAKTLRGWLDFDDLILKARALLSDSSMAAWVLYRIDGGIDHILVDEAQDTSPRQWEVIERLTQEFFSGAGARDDEVRTLFVVGDKKQSIYSFQGADPEEFDRKAGQFQARIEGAQGPFQHRSLDFSFRSASAILRLVDTTFDATRLPRFGKQSEHIAFKTALPGRVDLWPLVEPAEAPEVGHWTDPLDRISARHHTVQLAEQIAERIDQLCGEEHYLPDEIDGSLVRRRVEPGDFLILVQRRSALFSQIIRACKVRGLPIAGADRLKVGAELAVKDLAALLSFLATSDDDLSLATALKSPLFGWDERQLFGLAHGRPGRLWEALRESADYPQTVQMLRDLRGQTDFLRPYDLLERILTRHDGRARLLARLGPEAEDGINALLSQALAYERTAVPSLTGFIEWMQTDELEIKRQIDSASNQIRVMTVHGAKGLEAPIVILPDTGRRDIRIRDEILTLNGRPVWRAAANDMPAPLAEAVEQDRAAELQERLRLLYVALTRAEKWLIVAAAGDLPKDGSAWYQLVQEAMEEINAETLPDGGLRFQEGAWDDLPIRTRPVEEGQTPALEPMFSQPEGIYTLPGSPLSPSDLGGAKIFPGDQGADGPEARAYGTYLHLLLERLAEVPATERAALSATLPCDLPEELARTARSEALDVLAAPDLAPLFTPESLAEVPLSAPIQGQPFYGLIDRLIIAPERILAVDFKSNRVVPERAESCPEGLLRQMGAYLQMLRALYPEARVEVAILWTAARRLMPLPHDLVTRALHRAPLLDGAPGRT